MLNYQKYFESMDDGIESYTIWNKYCEIKNPKKMDEYLKKELIGKTVQFKDKNDGKIYINKIINAGYEYGEGFCFTAENGINHYINIDCPIKYIVGKKKRNTEMDPFDEENWGFIQEQKHYGDVDDEDFYILVTPRLEYWIAKEGWSMNDFIGKTFKAKRSNGLKGICPEGCFRLDNESVQENVIRNYTYYNWYIPFDSAEIINSNKKRRRLENPEIDPFGEEVWGYIQENVDDTHNIKVGDGVRLSKNFKIEDEGDEQSLEVSTDRGIVTNIRPHLKYPISVSWSNEKVSVYKSYELELCSDNRKKIGKPEIDPFGEEEWWE